MQLKPLVCPLRDTVSPRSNLGDEPVCGSWGGAAQGCQTVTTSFRSPDDVMAMPSFDLGDRLAADWADAPLLFPEIEQLPLPNEVVRHPDAEAFLEIDLPGWIVGVGPLSDLRMALDRHLRCGEEPDWSALAFRVEILSREDPMSIALGAEVFVLDPRPSFLGVSSLCPSP